MSDWLTTRLGPALLRYVADGGVRLNLGCGRNIVPGWINIDRAPGPGVDVVTDLERGELWTTLGTRAPANSVDTILACHVLEHIHYLIPLLRECHRVLRPGGHLVVLVPHLGSDDAWEDPTHVRAFSERSWIYFQQATYEQAGRASAYASGVDFTFEPVLVYLVPTDEWRERSVEDLTEAVTRYRNVVREIHFVLQKQEAA